MTVIIKFQVSSFHCFTLFTEKLINIVYRNAEISAVKLLECLYQYAQFESNKLLSKIQLHLFF